MTEKKMARRMTYKELSRWLREKPTREYQDTICDYIFTGLDYRESKQNKEVSEDIRIREDDGEWREPLMEIRMTRRMTYKELSRWLKEKPTREYKDIICNYIITRLDYREPQNEEVSENIRIREDDGEWREPLVEIEE